MASLAGKILFITGASRGIGLAIAVRAARDGARVAIAAKTSSPHPKLPGTIHTAAEQVRAAGGEALALECDIRFEQQIEAAVASTVERFGGLDICVNNASAISLTSTLQTDPKRYDLMHQINARGSFMVSRACVPHLRRAANPHVLMLSPPLNLVPEWFAAYAAYALTKYSMSIYAMAMAQEFRADGIAFNTLWPQTIIDTAAIRNLLGGESAVRRSRKPDIVADAAHAILTKPSREFTGRHCIDEQVLADAGVTDFSAYRTEPGTDALTPDLFVP
ncbi:MAG TPA: NAD(P)-dependent oxidoreductase [Steroidobacteraceae bacterium]|jgi:citronellol/citronellal dehydrogenase